jgi:hypothetical protein
MALPQIRRDDLRMRHHVARQTTGDHLAVVEHDDAVGECLHRALLKFYYCAAAAILGALIGATAPAAWQGRTIAAAQTDLTIR